MEAYKKRFGFYPEAVHADGIYARETIDSGLRITVSDLQASGLAGQKKRLPITKKISARLNGSSDRMSGCVSQSKGSSDRPRTGTIRARLPSTYEAWVRSIFLVMNLIVLLRFLLPARKIAELYAMFKSGKVYMGFFKASLRRLNPFIMPAALG